MQQATQRSTKAIGRIRSAARLAAVTSAAVLCAAAAVAIGGDHARLPSSGVATAATRAPIEPPGEAAKRSAARQRIDAARAGGELVWPLQGEVTSHFGDSRGGRSHEGLDIPMPAGTPIRAAADGRVVMREVQDGYGKYTCIAHERTTTCYGHQSRFRTARGATVTRGQVIGHVGNTGNSPTTHLHFEVRRGTRPWGTAMDPARFLPR
jgi:murein DD-endopeptidase MepM/ murein hydrolase activator NlpD